MTNGKMTFLHFQLGKGRCTCALRWNPDNTESVEVGMSFCSPKDLFNKKRGRAIATGRLLQGSERSFSFRPSADKRIKEQVYDLIQERALQKKSLKTRLFDSLNLDLPGWASRRKDVSK